MSAPGRPCCAACGLPLRACLCPCVRTVPHRTPVRVLQHADEAGHAKNSVRLLRRCLPDCELMPAAEPEPGDWLLYPGGVDAAPHLPVRRLWVIDGSWRQSRVLLREQPALAALPRVSLPAARAADTPLYAGLRKAQRAGQWSSLEAVAAALALLEAAPAIETELLGAFADWLRLQTQLRQ